MQNLFAGSDAGTDKPIVALKAVARTLDLLDADIVALQEVASQTALQKLNDHLRVPYTYAHCLPGNSARSIHLAYLSRRPVQLRSHADLCLTDGAGQRLSDYAVQPAKADAGVAPLRLQRDLLQARLLNDAGECELVLFNVHLKSKTEQDWRLLSSDAIRSAEGWAVARAVSAFTGNLSQVPVLLLGDFNDKLDSEALAGLRSLAWVDAVAVDHANLGRKGHLPGTYWPKRRARLDHVLLNGIAALHLQPGSARTHAGSLAQRASDHYPVSVTLTL